MVAPAFQAVLEREGPIDLASLMAQALAMGDEMHMRNAAATGLLARRLAAPLVGVVADRERARRRSCASLTRDNDQFFLAWSMCAAKAAARAIDGLEGSTVVSDDGAQRRRVRHPRGRARRPLVHRARQRRRGPLLSRASRAADANLDTGDSAIMETYGLGGMAMAASPAVQKIVGAKSFADAVATSRGRWRRSAPGANPLFPLAPLDGDGTPTGIDIRKVVRTGIVPADQHRHRAPQRAPHDRRRHRDAPRSQPFVDALVAFGARYRREADAARSRAPCAIPSRRGAGARSTRTPWC